MFNFKQLTNKSNVKTSFVTIPSNGTSSSDEYLQYVTKAIYKLEFELRKGKKLDSLKMNRLAMLRSYKQYVDKMAYVKVGEKCSNF